MFSLRIRDPWKKRDLEIKNARLTRVAIVTKDKEGDSRFDLYSIVFRSEDGRQFAITAEGREIGTLLQHCCCPT